MGAIGGTRILVVEDERGTAQIIKKLLERKMSAEVVTAGDCSSARAALSNGDFDLATLDYQLPDGDGLELLEEMSAKEGGPAAVMVTGHGDEQVAATAFNLGAAGYVVKDKRMGTMLVETAERALALRRAERLLTIQRDLAISSYGGQGMEEILRASLEAILEATGLDSGGVYIVDERTGALELAYHRGLSDEFVEGVRHFEKDEPSARLVREGVPVFSTHEEINPSRDEARVAEGLRFLAVIPLRHQDEIVGCLNVASHTLEDIPEESQRVIEILAGQVAQVVARARLAEAIKKSEERLRTVTDTASDAIMMTQNGIVTFWNPAAEKIFGYTAEEAVGSDLVNLTVPQPFRDIARRRIDEFDGAIPETRVGWTEELIGFRKDGGSFPMEIAVSGTKSDGKWLGVVFMRDITERKRSEKIVKAERDLALRLARTSDFEQTVEAIFHAILEATGFDCGGVYVIGDGGLDLAYHEGLSPAFVEAVEHLDADSPQYRLVNDGGTLYMDFDDLPIPKDERMARECLGTVAIIPIKCEGEIIGCVNVASRSVCEVTEESKAVIETLVGEMGQAIARARMASVLKEDEEFFRLLSENVSDGIAIHADGVTLDIDEGFARLYGYEPSEMIGRPVLDFIHPDYHELVLGKMREGFSGTYELALRRADGSPVPAEVSAFETTYRGRRVRVVAMKDITERKEYEEELRRVNSELEGYANAVSHDLRGPLSSVMMSLELLLGAMNTRHARKKQPELLEALEVAYRGTVRAHSLVRDLLVLAQAGQVPKEAVDVDVTKVVRTILRERANEMVSLGASAFIEGDLGHIRANPAHVYQVFSNLIANALQHNDSARPEVRVSRLAEDDDESHGFLVSDNGPGIPPDMLDNIFLPFEKGESGQTGIGLSIVEKIVESYGGEIRAYNDGGARFEFTLRDSAAES